MRIGLRHERLVSKRRGMADLTEAKCRTTRMDMISLHRRSCDNAGYCVRHCALPTANKYGCSYVHRTITLELSMATSSRRVAPANGSRPSRPAKAASVQRAPRRHRLLLHHLRISRLTVDKLGVKLYDKASAVVAELIANGYDADAETVEGSPALEYPACLKAGGQLADLGYVIEVEDDGHGMTPEEAIDFYLRVGADRRTRVGQDGSRSRKRNVP